MTLTGKTYDVLKFLAQIVFPGVATLYFTLAGLWNLPAAEQVVGTIVALDTFLGVVLQLSSSAFNNSDDKFDGHVTVDENTKGKKTVNLELKGDPEATIANQNELRFKIKKA